MFGALNSAAARPSIRREYFTSYPQGGMLLTGLVSALFDSGNYAGNPQYTWTEDRYVEDSIVLAQYGANGPFADNAGTSNATLAVAGASTVIRLAVITDSIRHLRPNTTWILRDVRLQGGTMMDLIFFVENVATAIDANKAYITCRLVNLTGAITLDNGSTINTGLYGLSTGSAHVEGSTLPTNANVQRRVPSQVTNFNQIHRTPMKLTGTAASTVDKDNLTAMPVRLRQIGLNQHMVGIENSIIFGRRVTEMVNDSNGDPQPRNFSGGIDYFLDEWMSANGGLTGYRPGQAAAFAHSNEACRRYVGTAGVLTAADWKSSLRRTFNSGTAGSNERLCFGGVGFISAIQSYYEGKVVINRDMKEEHNIGFNLKQISEAEGTLYLATHPRFSTSGGGSLTNSGFIIDPSLLELMPMTAERDTHYRPNIGSRRDDALEDEWFSDLTFVMRYPEIACGFRGVGRIA